MNENKNKEEPIKKQKTNKRKYFWLKVVIFAVIIVALVLGITIYLHTSADKARNAERSRVWIDAKSYCESLFPDGIIGEYVSEPDLVKCENKLNLVHDQSATTTLRESVNEARAFFEFKNKITQFSNKDGTLKEEVTEADIADAERFLMTLREPYRKKLEPILMQVREEYDKINSAKNAVLGLFESLDDIDNYEQAGVSEYVDRDKYNQVKDMVDSLSQPNIKEKLYLLLDKVEQKVAEDERIFWQQQEEIRLERERILKEQREAELQRQAEISAAWHIMNLPYISQNKSEVFNGCEAAALLMSLQYKGLLIGKSYREFVDEMPKANNPQEGFYLDIYGTAPESEPHWIDTAPLVEYGRSSSNSEAVYNLTGSDISVLKNEVVNNNPVIIYVTYNFNNPKETVGGVPVNLHIVVLSGYNEITNEYQVTDPWTRKTGDYIFTIPGDKVENLYNQVGRRAIVVR